MSDQELLKQAYQTTHHAAEQMEKLYDGNRIPVEVPAEHAVEVFRWFKQQLNTALGAVQELENRAIQRMPAKKTGQ